MCNTFLYASLHGRYRCASTAGLLFVVCALSGCSGGGGTGSSAPGASSSASSASGDDFSPPPEAVFECPQTAASASSGGVSTDTLSINGKDILVNGDPVLLKGVVFEPWHAGEAPGSADSVPDQIPYRCLFEKAAGAGADLIATSFAGPEQMRQAYFQAAVTNDLKLVVGIWFSGEADDWDGTSGDFQDPDFKQFVKEKIRSVIDRIHTGFDRDYSAQVIYFNLGNEFSEHAVNTTNESHPGIISYTGTYISAAEGANATEAFLAEMADYVKTYEQDAYGVQHPVTHTTWPVVSPDLLDTGFLDIVSYNLYSYWPPFVSGHTGGSVTGTAYQGALEELAGRYPDRPFVVSEFGLSTAPESVLDNAGTEQDQAMEIVDRWRDITTGPDNLAGGYVFQLVDQWYKNDAEHADDGRSQFSHDPSDSEEWFGVIGMNGDVDEVVFHEKPSYSDLMELWLSASE